MTLEGALQLHKANEIVSGGIRSYIPPEGMTPQEHFRELGRRVLALGTVSDQEGRFSRTTGRIAVRDGLSVVIVVSFSPGAERGSTNWGDPVSIETTWLVGPESLHEESFGLGLMPQHDSSQETWDYAWGRIAGVETTIAAAETLIAASQ